MFYVSLSTDTNAVTLFVSSNETGPTIVTSHPQKIQGQLKELKSVVELVLQKTIYEHHCGKNANGL